MVYTFLSDHYIEKLSLTLYSLFHDVLDCCTDIAIAWKHLTVHVADHADVGVALGSGVSLGQLFFVLHYILVGLTGALRLIQAVWASWVVFCDYRSFYRQRGSEQSLVVCRWNKQKIK